MSARIEAPLADVAVARLRNLARNRSLSWRVFVFLLVWAGSALYLFPFVDRGWIAHDEGMLAQSAERVIQGQVPHRDFDEPYSGLLTYFHAAAFEGLGTSLRTLRLFLFGVVLLFIPAVYAIARRIGSPLVAALVTFACLVWTFPNYFSSMPSWYYLVFSVFGAYAVIRHFESGRLGWLFLAGLCAGLALDVIIVGLYDVAAILLVLAFREQALASASGSAVRSRAFAWGKTLVLALFVLVAIYEFRTRTELVDLIHFVLPPAALALLLAGLEWRDGRGTFWERARGLVRLTAPFLAGVAIPILLFVWFYASRGALPALVEGLFTRPQRQIAFGKMTFLERTSLIALLPYAALIAFPAWLARRRKPATVAGLAVVLGLLLWACSGTTVYRWVWTAARTTDVVLVVVGCWVLWTNRQARGAAGRGPLFLFVALAACIGLVQFPFSVPIYYCYAVPFTILGIAYLVSGEAEDVGWAHLQILAFAIAFAVVYMNPGYIFFLGHGPVVYRADTRLSLPRGGLWLPSKEVRDLTQLVSMVREKAGDSQIYAGPEGPEVYFLCEKPNLTRIFFEGPSGVTPTGDTATLAKLFEREDLKVVVWNRSPQFTHGLWRVYRERLWQRFPNSTEIGKYTVMWRD